MFNWCQRQLNSRKHFRKFIFCTKLIVPPGTQRLYVRSWQPSTLTSRTHKYWHSASQSGAARLSCMFFLGFCEESLSAIKDIVIMIFCNIYFSKVE